MEAYSRQIVYDPTARCYGIHTDTMTRESP